MAGTVGPTVKVSGYDNREVAPPSSSSPVSPGQSVHLCQQQGSLSQSNLVSLRAGNRNRGEAELHSQRTGLT